MIEAIPEITDKQLRLIQNVANSQFNRVVYTLPDALKDTNDVFADRFETQKNLDYLVSLGFLTNVTEDAGDLLEALKVHEREFRVFTITPAGSMMFDLSFSDNRAN